MPSLATSTVHNTVYSTTVLYPEYITHWKKIFGSLKVIIILDHNNVSNLRKLNMRSSAICLSVQSSLQTFGFHTQDNNNTQQKHILDKIQGCILWQDSPNSVQTLQFPQIPPRSIRYVVREDKFIYYPWAHQESWNLHRLQSPIRKH